MTYEVAQLALSANVRAKVKIASGITVEDVAKTVTEYDNLDIYEKVRSEVESRM